jgi:hypothetical protein
MIRLALATAATLAALTATVHAGPAQDRALAHYAAQAKVAPGFDAFSADRGKTLFTAKHTGGKPDTPSCTSCHGGTPLATGQTRAGKEIAPMALSKSPDRYGDVDKLEKWFDRNCTSVLGRACTPVEKGDFITFMVTQ